MSDPIIRYDETGTLDEFVFEGATIHFERMDEAAWWMGIDLPDGTRYMVNCGAVNPKAKGFVNIELDMPAHPNCDSGFHPKGTVKILDTIAAIFDLKAAEIRTGISLVEAVALDERLTELRMIGDPAELLGIAVTAGKLGLTESDLEPMVRHWHLSRSRFEQLARQAERYADELDPNSAYLRGTA